MPTVINCIQCGSDYKAQSNYGALARFCSSICRARSRKPAAAVVTRDENALCNMNGAEAAVYLATLGEADLDLMRACLANESRLSVRHVLIQRINEVVSR